MICADRVEKRFGKVRALAGVSFAIDRGGSVALWGGNGAGKTTLIRCILGIVRHRGSISVDGLDPRRHGKAVRARIGYVPQELAFHDDMRLGDAMAFFARLRGVPVSRSAERLDRVGLAGHETRRVRDLSGGMKQRLALAVALLADPPVILLDEPTSNLDAGGREEVMRTLRALRGEGKTIVFASHRSEEVLALAERILVLEGGRLVRDCAPSEVWPTATRTLRIRLVSAEEPEAARVLRERGLAVECNGRGLMVCVPADRKGEPISLLGEARILVRDFELVDGPGGDR